MWNFLGWHWHHQGSVEKTTNLKSQAFSTTSNLRNVQHTQGNILHTPGGGMLQGYLGVPLDLKYHLNCFDLINQWLSHNFTQYQPNGALASGGKIKKKHQASKSPFLENFQRSFSARSACIKGTASCTFFWKFGNPHRVKMIKSTCGVVVNVICVYIYIYGYAK